MKPRFYTDTSVLGGCEDTEFRNPSRSLIKSFRTGKRVLVISEIMLRELDLAPEAVQLVLQQVPLEHIETLALSEEAEALATAYIDDGAIVPRMRADALHIALATVARHELMCL
jgi:hypothetical protein